MMVYLFGLGLAMPQALAGALQPFPERAGAASSLIGCVQQSVAAATGALVGQSLGATAWPLVIGVAVAGRRGVGGLGGDAQRARAQHAILSPHRRPNSRSRNQPSSPRSACGRTLLPLPAAAPGPAPAPGGRPA